MGNLQQSEQKKFECVRDNIENKILHHRFANLGVLNTLLKKEFDIEANVSSNSAEDAEEAGFDFHLLAGINKDWGYVDIYYLVDNGDRLFITELNVSEE